MSTTRSTSERKHSTRDLVGRAYRSVLKEPLSLYRPRSSPAWLKLKPKFSLDAVVTGGSAERIRWGDWGEAVMLELR